MSITNQQVIIEASQLVAEQGSPEIMTGFGWLVLVAIVASLTLMFITEGK